MPSIPISRCASDTVAGADAQKVDKGGEHRLPCFGSGFILYPWHVAFAVLMGTILGRVSLLHCVKVAVTESPLVELTSMAKSGIKNATR